MNYLKSEYSEEAVVTVEERGEFFDSRRWPPKPSSEASRLVS
jgi:hypothetical protein